jgi:hypothetical protein
MLKLVLKMMLSSDNENHDSSTNKDKKAIEELKKKQRESEQLDVDPEQVLEEEEKRQPYSVENE